MGLDKANFKIEPDLGEEMLFQCRKSTMAPGWKATFWPAKGSDQAKLGVFVRGHGKNVRPFFRNFLQRFNACKASQSRDIEKMKILSVRPGGDPICVLSDEITADSLLVARGAVGQRIFADPLYHEGCRD